MKLLKEIYFSIFVVFFRIGEGQWPSAMKMDSFKGMFGHVVLDIFFFMSLYARWCIYSGTPMIMNFGILVIFVILIVISNYIILVFRARGASFEKEFSLFSAPKKGMLISAAVTVIITDLIFLALSVQAYHKAFSIAFK